MTTGLPLADYYLVLLYRLCGPMSGCSKRLAQSPPAYVAGFSSVEGFKAGSPRKPRKRAETISFPALNEPQKLPIAVAQITPEQLQFFDKARYYCA